MAEIGTIRIKQSRDQGRAPTSVGSCERQRVDGIRSCILHSLALAATKLHVPSVNLNPLAHQTV